MHELILAHQRWVMSPVGKTGIKLLKLVKVKGERVVVAYLWVTEHTGHTPSGFEQVLDKYVDALWYTPECVFLWQGFICSLVRLCTVWATTKASSHYSQYRVCCVHSHTKLNWVKYSHIYWGARFAGVKEYHMLAKVSLSIFVPQCFCLPAFSSWVATV